MITAQEQYRALVARLEEINPSEPKKEEVDPSQEDLVPGTYYPGDGAGKLYATFKL